MKVSVLGPAGSYSETAARAFAAAFDSSTPDFLFCSSIENTVLRLFEPDENNNVSCCAVIPIENSIEGAVGISMDLLLEKEITIIAELILPVDHCLLVSEKTAHMPDFSSGKIEVIYSHPQGLYQCRAYIALASKGYPVQLELSDKVKKLITKKIFGFSNPQRPARVDRFRIKNIAN